MENEIGKKIYDEIVSVVDDSGLPFYREPLMGIASADNRCLRRLKKIVHPGHLLPEEILAGARSVVAYYLPFKDHIPKENRKGRNASRLWAEVYILTNQLLSRIAEAIRERLAGEGFKCAWENPTHNFDTELLVSYWSHKHVAFACGLGRFGKNHLLITEKGCAGRIGSVVTDLEIEPTVADEDRDPFYSCPRNCRYCFSSCPAGALTEQSLNKAVCYQMLLENDRMYPDLGLCDVCGKCAAGPCSSL
ncbi:MAG: epoxyqueuosine reductase [Bacillota bacterium]